MHVQPPFLHHVARLRLPLHAGVAGRFGHFNWQQGEFRVLTCDGTVKVAMGLISGAVMLVDNEAEAFTLNGSTGRAYERLDEILEFADQQRR